MTGIHVLHNLVGGKLDPMTTCCFGTPYCTLFTMGNDDTTAGLPWSPVFTCRQLGPTEIEWLPVWPESRRVWIPLTTGGSRISSANWRWWMTVERVESSWSRWDMDTKQLRPTFPGLCQLHHLWRVEAILPPGCLGEQEGAASQSQEERLGQAINFNVTLHCWTWKLFMLFEVSHKFWNIKPFAWNICFAWLGL